MYRAVVRQVVPAACTAIAAVIAGSAASSQAARIPAGEPPVAGRLTGVVGIAPDDAWAVGLTGRPTEPSDPMIKHFDGTAWITDASVPDPGGWAYLEAVSATSTDDVWAAGYYTLGGFYPLIEHWNGKRWKIAPIENDAEGVQLHDVYAIAPDDVWADGWELDADFDHVPIVYHYDGAAWTPTADPLPQFRDGDVPPEREFTAISAYAHDDVWAVGSAENYSAPLAEHWDGKTWSVVSPEIHEPGETLLDVHATGPDTAVAISSSGLFRYNGSQWRRDRHFPTEYDLGAVDEPTRGNAWIVGQQDGRTAILHGDRSHWRRVQSPNRGSNPNWLQAVDARTSDDVWAVGFVAPSFYAFSTTLIEHWDGTSWSIST